MSPWEKWLDVRNKTLSHRHIIVISGRAQFTQQIAHRICKTFGKKHLWLGDSAFFTARGLPTKQAKKCLGRECDVGIYDAHSGFHASAFLSLSGTIVSNGLLLLCTPDFEEWPLRHAENETRHVSYGCHISSSNFIRRWIQGIRKSSTIPHIVEGENEEVTTRGFNDAICEPQHSALSSSLKPFATPEQSAVFGQIMRNTGIADVVIAKRGRGKSALLGLLAEQFLDSGHSVVLCSSHKSNCESIFKHLNEAKHKLAWHPPDHPALNKPIDVLLIDEVASLPVLTVLSIIKNCKRLIMATTVDGYEGTGRGFVTKLLPEIHSRYPSLQQHSLYAPIRFFPGDLLESHLSDVFMLGSASAGLTVNYNNLDDVTFERLDKARLNEVEYLRQVIDILTVAHYKTTPEDIIRIVDMPDTILITAHIQRRPIAAAVIIEEGSEILAGVSQEIACGERRVKGHLLAQSMALSASRPDYAGLKYWRVNRIAVCPPIQRQGIGKALLRFIESHAIASSVDVIGTTFGATLHLLSFWHNCEYVPIRLGSKPDAASGESSTMLIKPLTRTGNQAMQTLRSLLLADLNSRESKAHPNEIRHFLFTICDTLRTDIEYIYQNRILDYINGTRSHLHLGNAIGWWLTKRNAHQIEALDELIADRWVHQLNDDEIIKKHALSGRSVLYEKLDTAFTMLYWSEIKKKASFN